MLYIHKYNNNYEKDKYNTSLTKIIIHYNNIIYMYTCTYTCTLS